MIDPSGKMFFPNNIVMVLESFAKQLDPDLADCVFVRPLRPSDPIQAVGIFATLWQPNENSYETGGPAVLGGYRQEATINQYMISIQAFIKDGDQVRGLATSALLAKMLRDMLLRNPEVGVALAALSVTDAYGLTERTQRRWVRTQRFASNEISGSWVYLATIELMIETETA